MRISITKLSDERHRLEIHRRVGGAESVELETRSFLLHDLVHYAVEAEAGIADGFWGLLASGHTLQSLSDRSMANPKAPGIMLAEQLVGPMQSVHNGRLEVARYLENAGPLAPSIVDAAFVERVRERLRRLWGAWRATPFREAMELTWPPPERPIPEDKP